MNALSTLPLPPVTSNAASSSTNVSRPRVACAPKFSYEPPQTVDFSRSLLDSHRMPAPGHSSTITYSIVLHVFLVAAALLVPMWFANTLDLRTYTTTLLVAPPPPPAPPAPSPAVAKAVSRLPVEHRFTAKNQLVLPPSIPKRVVVLNEAPVPDEGTLGIPGGVEGGVPGGVLGGIGIFEAKAPVAPDAPLPSSATEKVREPVKVGGNVKPPRVLSRQAPAYPTLARQSMVQGDVVIAAIIDAQGNVTEMKVISGHPLLINSAMAALRNWKFEPTYLNGEPWPISWTVTINFRLG